ncbi:MAG: hypothetical protein M0R80_24510 [Proteobacteria bacterium]|nr:hypothetical protein [Pseudomonadota bacterium]
MRTARVAAPLVLLFAPLVLLADGAAPPATPLVPIENCVKGAPPAAATAEEGARRLLAAIVAREPALAKGFFFPADAFDLVKAIASPGRYHRKLVLWYEQDILAEHERFADPSWRFRSLELGRCRWQEKETEGNSLPYWSCRGNRVTAASGDRTRRFDITVLINWGDRWYVTHLGPIRS